MEEIKQTEREIEMLKAIIEKNIGHWTIPIIKEELTFQENKLRILKTNKNKSKWETHSEYKQGKQQ